MNPTRIWTLGAVVAVVAILGGAAGLGIQPTLATASAADASAKQVQAQNDTSQTELSRLAGVAAKQSDLETTERRLASAVTSTLKLNTFSRQLRTVAALDGVKITTLVTGAGVAYAAPVVPDAAAATSSGSSTPAPTATPTVAAAPVAVAGQYGATDPLITATNFVAVPVTVIVTGEEAAGLKFAQDAQHMQRLFAVDTVLFTKATGADTVSTTTINGTIYSLKR